MASFCTAAFTVPIPVFTSRSAFVQASSVRRLTVPRPRSRCTPTMDFLTEVFVKALEVGAATYATRTLASNSSGSKATSEGGVRDAVPNFTALPEKMRSLLESAEAGAAKLPEYLESSSPESRKWIKLAMCVVIDLIGSGTLAIPLISDALDLAWAPVDAFALQALFGNPLITAGGFAEEILPGTDGIPTATLAWVYEFYWNDIRKALDSSTDVSAVQVEEESKRGPFSKIFNRREKAQRR